MNRQSVLINYGIFAVNKRQHIVDTLLIYALAVVRKIGRGYFLYLVCRLHNVLGKKFDFILIRRLYAAYRHHLSRLSVKRVAHRCAAYTP